MTMLSLVWLGAVSILVILEGLVIIGLLRSFGDLYERQRTMDDTVVSGDVREGPECGSTLPDSVLRDLDGNPVRLSALWDTNGLGLLFVKQGCVACRDTLKVLAQRSSASEENGQPLCVIAAGTPPVIRYLLDDANVPPSVRVLITDVEQFDRMSVKTTPALVIVDSDGRIVDSTVGPAAGTQLQLAKSPRGVMVAADQPS